MALARVLRRISPFFNKRILNCKLCSRVISKNITISSKIANTVFSTRYLAARYYSKSLPESIELDNATYERVCSETLESLCEYFEELVEDTEHLKSADVSYSSGVINVNFGKPHGTYVINRQSPNKQIWLSSPKSGPKRYDFVIEDQKDSDKGKWIYKHTGESLHELLQREIKEIVKSDVDFFKLPYT